MNRQKVCVQGLGFVGSAMSIATANARIGNKYCFNVIGLDIKNDVGIQKINQLNAGKFPFETTDNKLIEATKNAVQNNLFRATFDTAEFDDADIVVVDINLDIYYREDGTPYLNLDNFKTAIQTIGQHIKEETLVIIETTVPPGTCLKVVKPTLEKEFKKRKLNPNTLRIAHSYERVMPGNNYYDSIVNYWRVYSGIDDKSSQLCEKFLSAVINTEKYPLVRLKNTTSSETAKVLENSYRACNIAFMEEWGRFAEDVGIDMFEIVNAIRMRPTHSNIRQPGFGVGGYCLTKDPLFAKLSAKDLFGLEGHTFDFCTKSVAINNRMPLVSLEKIKKYFNNDCNNKKLLMLGISYKQDVGDTRYSPSEIFVKAAKKIGFSITCYDPLVSYWTELNLKTLSCCPNMQDFDVIILTVAHREFLTDEFCDNLVATKALIFDANNILTKRQIKKLKNNNIHFIGRGGM